MKKNDFIVNTFYVLPTIQVFWANYPMKPKDVEIYLIWLFWEIKIYG